MDQLVEQLNTLSNASLNDEALFLVDLKIKPKNNIKVFIDGDNGINIDTISKVNKTLYKKIEASELFPDDDFSLEVSSPGIDAPLKLKRQYFKNIGRTVEVTLLEEKKINGILKSVTDSEICIEKKLTKKQIKEGKEQTISIPFENIISTTIEITF